MGRSSAKAKAPGGERATESGQGLQPSPPANASLSVCLSYPSCPPRPSHSHACTYTQTCRHTTHMHARTHTHVHIYTTSSFLLQSLFGAHGFSISGIPNLRCLVMVFVSSHSLGLTQLVSPTLQGSVRLLSTPLCQLCAQLS